MNTCGSVDEACDDGHRICDSPADEEESADAFGLYRTGIECSTDTKDNKTIKPYVVNVQAGRANLAMEIDTGASRSTVSQYVYNALLSDYPLKEAGVTFFTYLFWGESSDCRENFCSCEICCL